MTLAPFVAAPAHIQTHILAAMMVLVLTPFQFFVLRKGSPEHRMLGYFWLFAMGVVALTSFFIRSNLALSFKGFSSIHLLSVLSVFSIGSAILLARAGKIAAHRKTLIMLTVSFLIAGAFTFAPHRIMGRMLLGLS